MSHIRHLLALFLLTATVYAVSLSYGLVYEDQHDWQGQMRTLSAGDLLRHPTRFLTDASFQANRAVSLEPWIDHAMNLLLHAGNVAVLYAIISLLAPTSMAFWGAALFAVHPINVEAVTYVSSRSELLGAFGVLLALWATTVGRSALAVCGLVVAVLGKETSIMAAGLVPLWGVWIDRPVRWPWAWTAVAGLGLGLSWSFGGGTVLSLDQITSTSAAIWRLSALVVIPWGFTIDHDWQRAGEAYGAVALIAWVVVLAASVWLLQNGWWRQVDWVALIVIWTAILTVPRFVQGIGTEGLHEHHWYVVVAGMVLAFTTRRSL